MKRLMDGVLIVRVGLRVVRLTYVDGEFETTSLVETMRS